MFDGEADTSDDVIGYIDSDFARSKTDQKSTKSYLFILIKAEISHSFELQLIIALSTHKIEYIAIYEVIKKAV